MNKVIRNKVTYPDHQTLNSNQTRKMMLPPAGSGKGGMRLYQNTQIDENIKKSIKQIRSLTRLKDNQAEFQSLPNIERTMPYASSSSAGNYVSVNEMPRKVSQTPHPPSSKAAMSPFQVSNTNRLDQIENFSLQKHKNLKHVLLNNVMKIDQAQRKSIGIDKFVIEAQSIGINISDEDV
jgi:hypothetical protein